MNLEFDNATLSVQLKSETHTMGEVEYIVNVLGNIPMIAFWAALANVDKENKTIVAAQAILREGVSDNKALNRFYPEFAQDFINIGSDNWVPFMSLKEYNPFDPLDLGVITGIHTWARHQIFRSDRELHDILFRHAEVSRLEHHSPLVLELAVIIAIPTIPVLLIYSIMRAAIAYRKMEAEARIREREADIKDEELSQKKIQTAILDEIRKSLEEQQTSDTRIRIPDGVLENAANFAVSTVSELSKSPIIEKVTFGISSKS